MYVHFFLFRCPGCKGFLARVCASPESNLEYADAHLFCLQCQCGWIKQLPGFAATRHWVELGEYIDLRGVAYCSIFLEQAA